jgi:hypothetical protein
MQHRQGLEPLSFEDALANEAALLPSELERIACDPFTPSETAQRIAYVARAGATQSSSNYGSRCFSTNSCSC